MAEADEELISSLRRFIVAALNPPPKPRKEIPRWQSILGLVLLAIGLALFSTLLSDSHSPFWAAIGKIGPFLFGASLAVLLEQARKAFAEACGRPVGLTLICIGTLVIVCLWWISVDETRIPVRLAPGTTLTLADKPVPVSAGEPPEIVIPGLRREVLTITRKVSTEDGAEMEVSDSVYVSSWRRIASTGVAKYAFGEHPLDLTGTQVVSFDFGVFEKRSRTVRVEGWFPAWYRERPREGYRIADQKGRGAREEGKDSLSVTRTFPPNETAVLQLPAGNYRFHVSDAACERGRRAEPLTVVDSLSRVLRVDTIPCLPGG